MKENRLVYRAGLCLILILTLLPHLALAQGATTHTVRSGETLYSIARRYGTTVNELKLMNGLAGELIYVGQLLSLPGGATMPAVSTPSANPSIYTVQRGDTLTSIATRYGTTAATLARANNLYNASLIYVGQKLRIPAGANSTSPAPTNAMHVVQRGETLVAIARQYQTSLDSLMRANGLQSPDYIYVGQSLSITDIGSAPNAGAPPLGPIPDYGAKRIVIDLSDQSLTAYSSDVYLYSAVVSTGVAWYPTPVGTYEIYVKYPSQAMSGPGYYLPGVPHVMYFYRGYAIHGTYWHNNFGTPMSHGCVNMRNADAEWLYNWAEIGTKVVVQQ